MTRKRKTLTLRQIAELAGTSKSTVSRVLTHHPSVSPETRAHIEEVIKKHGFEPNIFARGLAGGRTGLIAVICSEITSGFFAEVLHGIDEVAQHEHGHLLSCVAHGVDDYVQLWQSFARPGRVDGTILIAPPVELFEYTVDSALPMALCAARPSASEAGQGWNTVDTATVDNKRAFHRAVEHVYTMGCRKMVHVAGPHNIHDARLRRQGFEEATAAHDDIEATIIDGGLEREDGARAMSAFLSAHDVPDAVLAFNDSLAYGILSTLQECEIDVPGRIAVSGCDDEPASSILGLTTLHMPMRELGREAGRLLFEKLRPGAQKTGVQHSVLNLSLEIRRSTDWTPDS